MPAATLPDRYYNNLIVGWAIPISRFRKLVNTMRMTVLRGGALVLFSTAVAGAAVIALRAPAADKPKDDVDFTVRIDARVQAWQPVPDERRLDQVGWASDIRSALSLAKEHKRPVFLFTYSGCS